MKLGIHESQRHAPVYQLTEILGPKKSRALLKARILTERDVTNIWIQSAAFKVCPKNHLYNFGEDGISLPDGRKVSR